MTMTDLTIRPFEVHVPDEDLADLQRRAAATRWPGKELVADRSQGVQLATIQALVTYWGAGYDWRACETKLNALPQFVTEIDGLDIHFVTAFPVPEHRAEVVAAFEAAIARVHDEPGVELYALHEGPGRLVMIEKYESGQARSEHLKAAALADLRSALAGKLSSGLDAQALVPHPAGDAQKGAL